MSNEMKDWLEEQKQENAMSIAECQVETQKHIERVRHYIRFVTDKLTLRGVKHDAIKLESPEIELFALHTKCLADTAYNSEEYIYNEKELNFNLFEKSNSNVPIIYSSSSSRLSLSRFI